MDLFADKVIRNSYGLREDIRLDDINQSHPRYRELELLAEEDDGEPRNQIQRDRALWLAIKDTSISEVTVTEGVKRLTATDSTNPWPFSWEIPIVVSGHDVSGTDERYRVDDSIRQGKVKQVSWISMLIYERDIKVDVVYPKFDPAYIEFAFRARVSLEKLRPELVVSFPRNGGSFYSPLTHDWKEDDKECQTHKGYLDHLVTHAASRDNEAARLDAGCRQTKKLPETYYEDAD